MVKINDIDACLPQTQCTECNYPGCLPYAEAIYNGQESIDKCPPGGVKTLKQLAALLSLDPAPYLAKVKANTRPAEAAVIREAECIGCTKCIQACPVDAIVGAAKLMHSVIEQDCTGCNLCVEPCPVDCIDMVEIPQPLFKPERARQQFDLRQSRLIRIEQQKKQLYLAKKQLANKQGRQQEIKAKQYYILQALARVKNKTDNRSNE